MKTPSQGGGRRKGELNLLEGGEREEGKEKEEDFFSDTDHSFALNAFQCSPRTAELRESLCKSCRRGQVNKSNILWPLGHHEEERNRGQRLREQEVKRDLWSINSVKSTGYGQREINSQLNRLIVVY